MIKPKGGDSYFTNNCVFILFVTKQHDDYPEGAPHRSPMNHQLAPSTEDNGCDFLESTLQLVMWLALIQDSCMV